MASIIQNIAKSMGKIKIINDTGIECKEEGQDKAFQISDI